MPGLHYEDFKVGQVFCHEVTRTLTEADNLWFSCLTLNPQPLHIDFNKAKSSEFGGPVVNSLLTLGLLVGLSVADTTLNTTIANLGFSDVKFLHPLFHGDSLRAETRVISKRPSGSRQGSGIVEFEHVGFNQEQRIVVTCLRSALMRMRDPHLVAGS